MDIKLNESELLFDLDLMSLKSMPLKKKKKENILDM
jgi:hypothetical protein